MAEQEKRAKIINAEGESLADIMMAHPLALQLLNLQSLIEIGVDKNTRTPNQARPTLEDHGDSRPTWTTLDDHQLNRLLDDPAE